MTPFLAEFIGTMLLILMGGGVVANVCLTKTKGNGAGWMAITTAWALGVFIGVVVAGPYSGAHLNPAVSIGLAIGGTFPWSEVPVYILAQFLGAALGALVVWLVYKDHFDATDSQAAKLGVFCTNIRPVTWLRVLCIPFFRLKEKEAVIGNMPGSPELHRLQDLR